MHAHALPSFHEQHPFQIRGAFLQRYDLFFAKLVKQGPGGPGRTVKKEQEEISPNHIQRINLISVEMQHTHPIFLESAKLCNYLT